MIEPPANVIRAYLVAVEAGALPPNPIWPIYTGFMPATPHAAITLYDTVGIDDGRYMATGERVEHPGVQTRVRAPSKEDAYARIYLIKEYLDKINREVIMLNNEVYRVENVTRTGPIISLGQEQGSTRHLYVVNSLVTITKE